MLRLDRILLASDFSASAEAALLYAAVLARQSQASLLVMHVIETSVAALPRWTDVFRSTEVFADMEAADRAIFERLMTHPALQGLKVEMIVQHGNPSDRITDMSARVNLVVMGTRGQDGVRGKAGGRVAHRVAHASASPVLLVPPGGGSAGLPAVGAKRLTLQRILLALNLAQYAPQAIELSRALTADCQATLLPLQVVDPDKISTYPIEPGQGMHHNIDGLKVLLEKRLVEVLPDAPEGPPLEYLVREGLPAEVILRQIETSQAHLVVMSAHAYSALRKFFTLSTVDAILAPAPCLLLAVPFPRPVVG